MAGHHVAADGPDPAAYDRLRPAIVAQIAAQGDEVGLHPSYTASERPERIAEERARLEQLTGAAVAGHALPLPAPRAALDPARGRPARLRLRLEPGLRRRDRPAGRLLVPVPALPPGRGPAARPDRAAAGRDGRDPGRGALPGASHRPRGSRTRWSCSSGSPTWAAPSPSCGTPTASAASTRAAGIASTTSVLEWVAGRGGRLVTAADAVASQSSASGRASAAGGGATMPAWRARRRTAAPGRRWPAWRSARARPACAAWAARRRRSAPGRGGA